MIVGVRSRASRLRSAAFGYANIVPYVLFALFPFYYMLITSLKNDAELYNLEAVPFLIQTGVITDHYRYLFFKTEFWTWMKNSLVISVVSTSVSLVISILAGYSLARLRFPGVASFGTAVLFAVCDTKVSAYVNSFHVSVKPKSVTQTMPGIAIGSTMRVRVCIRLAPSTSAHSSTSFGIVRK